MMNNHESKNKSQETDQRSRIRGGSHESSIEAALYGEDSRIRDQGRAQVIRSGHTRDVKCVVDALSAPLAVTRRRATRLLSDLQPHRALPLIRSWVSRISSQGWSVENVATKPIREGLVSAARLMNQLTPRGDHEAELLTLWSSPDLKVKRATICPASPPDLLAEALGDAAELRELAAAEALRRLKSLDPQTHDRRVALRSVLTSAAQALLTPPAECVDHTIHEIQSQDSQELPGHLSQPSINISASDMLLGYLFPDDQRWVTQALELNPLGLRCCREVTTLTDAVQNAARQYDRMGASRSLIEALIALERALFHKKLTQVTSMTSSFESVLAPELINQLSHHPIPQVRALVARQLPTTHQLLDQLVQDSADEVRWTARQVTEGRWSFEKLKARLGSHARLSLPSAQPPYGLREFDQLPTIERVRGALALCQARFDVNLGVAMRSAEAAGLSEVFVIGARSGSLTSARGAEHALPIIWLTDPYELIVQARQRGYQLVAIQQTPDSHPYHQAHYPPRPLFVLGSEDAGLPDELRVAADLVVEIPLYGAIDSLNVSTAATCVVMHWRAHLS